MMSRDPAGGADRLQSAASRVEKFCVIRGPSRLGGRARNIAGLNVASISLGANSLPEATQSR